MNECEKLSRISEVPVEVSAVLGNARMTVGSLLALEAGAVVELDRDIDDEIDICVNGSVVAKGALMIEDGRLGIEITKILPKEENRCE